MEKALAAPPPGGPITPSGPTSSQPPAKVQTGTPNPSSYNELDTNKQKMYIKLVDISNKMEALVRDPLVPSDIKGIIKRYTDQINPRIGIIPGQQMDSEKVRERSEKGEMIVPQEMVQNYKAPAYTPISTKFKV